MPSIDLYFAMSASSPSFPSIHLPHTFTLGCLAPTCLCITSLNLYMRVRFGCMRRFHRGGSALVLAHNSSAEYSSLRSPLPLPLYQLLSIRYHHHHQHNHRPISSGSAINLCAPIVGSVRKFRVYSRKKCKSEQLSLSLLPHAPTQTRIAELIPLKSKAILTPTPQHEARGLEGSGLVEVHSGTGVIQ